MELELNINSLKSETTENLRVLNSEMIDTIEKGNFEKNEIKIKEIEIEKLSNILVEKLENDNPKIIFVHQWGEYNTIQSFIGKLRGVGQIDNIWINDTTTTHGFGLNLDEDTDFYEYIQNIEDN